MRVRVNDCIIGKIFKQRGSVKAKGEVRKESEIRDKSMVIKSDEEGWVESVDKVRTPVGFFVKIVIRSLRVPEMGDKFCSNMAQKGTTGILYRQEDMPFTASGIVPDIIINPNCIPSRMTVNQLISMVVGKAVVLDDSLREWDGTTFADPRVSEAQKILTDHGFSPEGTEVMSCGFTGRKFKAQIMIGPTYYHRLKHMVVDKIHARAQGMVTALCRQPNCGRSQDGGLRFGEMEKDCMIAHGAAWMLRERLYSQSDPFVVGVCRDCKGMEVTAAGVCLICKGNDTVETHIPYATKILLQKLQVMGIKTELES